MPWPKQASKITFAQSKRRTLQSIIYSPEKKNGLEQEAFWHEKLCRRASKFCPDASVEITLTFSLRNTRDIPSRSNSKTLASTAELKFEFKSAISEFRIILSRSCISFLSRGLFVLWGGWGEIKRERARGGRHLIPSTKLTSSSHKTFHFSYMKFLDEMFIKVKVSSIFKEKNNSG